jgi:hypothetical protein
MRSSEPSAALACASNQAAGLGSGGAVLEADILAQTAGHQLAIDEGSWPETCSSPPASTVGT